MMGSIKVTVRMIRGVNTDKNRLPASKPCSGRVVPTGAENLNCSPDGVVIVSVTGLKDSFPLNAMAVTTDGDARKFIVFLLPSLRDLKLLSGLNEQKRN